MPQTITFSNAYKTGSFSYTWEQPNESKLNEGFGADGNRSVLSMKCKGDAAMRRNAAWAVLEYPSFGSITGPGAANWISRNIPLSYPVGTFYDPDSTLGFLYASRFLGGRGVGPVGQEGSNPALPLYQYYFYDLEMTDRTYDILTDAAVTPPSGQLSAPTLQAPISVSLPGVPSLYQTTLSYYFWATAVDADGETTLSSHVGPYAVVANGDGIGLYISQVTGALGYNIYASGDLLGKGYLIGSIMAAGSPITVIGGVNYYLFLSFLPPGSAAGPYQTLPTTNTTGSPLGAVDAPDEGYYIAYGTGATGGRYVTRWSEASNRGVTVPRGLYSYATYATAGRKQIPEGLLRLQPAVDLKYTHHMIDVKGVPHLAILNSQGYVNDRPFDGWPRGTLLLERMEPRYYRSAVGNRVVDLTYCMTALPNFDRYGYPQGHSAVFGYLGGDGDKQDGVTQPAIVDYVPLDSSPSWDGEAPYRFANFTKLFRPDQPS